MTRSKSRTNWRKQSPKSDFCRYPHKLITANGAIWPKHRTALDRSTDSVSRMAHQLTHVWAEMIHWRGSRNSWEWRRPKKHKKNVKKSAKALDQNTTERWNSNQSESEREALNIFFSHFLRLLSAFFLFIACITQFFECPKRKRNRMEFSSQLRKFARKWKN